MLYPTDVDPHEVSMAVSDLADISDDMYQLVLGVGTISVQSALSGTFSRHTPIMKEFCRRCVQCAIGKSAVCQELICSLMSLDFHGNGNTQNSGRA